MAKDRTLLITNSDGTEIQVDIPEGWYITYGPVAPGLSKDIAGKLPLALRIYESDKKQRAIFTGVQSFRDMSIPIRIKKINVQEKDGYLEVEGARKRTTFQARSTAWINPDDENAVAEFPQLGMPSDSEMFGEE